MATIDSFIAYLEDHYVVRSVGRDQVKLSGSCPFCGENRPDLRLYVNTKTGLGICFHCGQGFNAVRFVASHAGVTASKARNILDGKDDGFVKEDSIRDDDVPKIWWPPIEPIESSMAASAYVTERGIPKWVIDMLGLYFIPNDVCVDGRLYPTGNRIFFPVYNAAGQPVSWQGRDITGDAKVKYFSAPGSSLGDCLYGIHLALRNRPIIIVEGVMDMIGWLRAGYRNIVATFGKKISDNQVGMIDALSPNIGFIAWDKDAEWLKWGFIEKHAHRFGKLLIVDLGDKDSDECDKDELAVALRGAKEYSWASKILGAMGG